MIRLAFLLYLIAVAPAAAIERLAYSTTPRLLGGAKATQSDTAANLWTLRKGALLPQDQMVVEGAGFAPRAQLRVTVSNGNAVQSFTVQADSNGVIDAALTFDDPDVVAALSYLGSGEWQSDRVSTSWRSGTEKADVVLEILK